MHPNRPIAVDPIGERLAVVYLLIALNTIAIAAKGLDIPNETGAALGNRLNVIEGKFIKREFLITSEAMEIVELAKPIPFSDGVRATRLGFAGAANIAPFPLRLLALFGLIILLLRLLVLFGLLILSLILLTLFGLIILSLAYFTPTLESISFALVPIKPFSRFDLATLTTRLHHFVVSLFFRYLNYTTSRGKT